MFSNLIRMQFKTVYELLYISRELLGYLVLTVSKFLKAIRIGVSEQALVYFDYTQLIELYDNKIKSRTNTELEV